MADILSSRIKQELKSTILGLIGWIPFGYLFLPIYFAFFMIYILVRTLAKLFRPDLIPLTKVDSFLAFAPSNSPSSFVYTCQIWDVKGVLDVDSFRDHFHKLFLAREEDRKQYENLYCYFVNFLGYTFKKRAKEIDLNDHIQKLELKEGHSVEQFVGTWMVQHDIDESGQKRPDWRVKVIPHSNDKTTVIFKLSHGLCDGYSMVHLVGKLSGEQAPYMFREPVPSFLKQLRCLIQLPYLGAQFWMELEKNKRKLLSQFPPDPVNEEWLISFCTLDLQTVKQIRRVTGTNFITVLASVQVGALKRLMLDLCPEKDKDRLAQIDDIYIGHSMGWPQHPAMTGEKGMANHLTLNTLKASFKTDDPLERLLLLDKHFHETKSKGYPIFSYYGMFNLVKIQPSWLNVMIANGELSIMGVETGISSLLCSPNRHKLLGKPVEHLYLPVVTPSPFRKLKLMTVPTSHSGILDVSVNASTALVKNQEMLDRFTKIYFPHELEELRKRTGNIIE